jgi:5-methylthioadenosine/S-adenosylhomocysteine deaminase
MGMRDQPKKVETVVSNALVVTMDAAQRFFPDGAVAIDRGTIVGVGSLSSIKQEFRAARTVDARGGMLLPGLIDTHVHVGLNLNQFKPHQDLAQSFQAHSTHRGSHSAGWVQRDADYRKGLRHFYEACVEHGTDDAGFLAGEQYALLAIKSGTTLAFDAGGGNLESYAQAVLGSGLRLVLTNVSADLTPAGSGSSVETQRLRDTDAVLEEAAALHRKWAGRYEGRAAFWFNMFADVMASDELMRGFAALAERLDAGVYSHSGAQASHDAISVAMFGKRGLQRLDENGLLGPRWLGVHMGYLTDPEARLLAKRGASVCHVPSTSAFYGKGIITDRTMPMLSEAGVNVVLGTDDSWNGTILDEASRAYCFHKDAAGDTRVYPYYCVAEMLTICAAAALRRRHDLGSIEIGKRADLMVVDTDHPKYIDPEGPLQVFIKRGSPADINTTIVDGAVLMHDRELTTIDEEATMARIRERIKRRWA